MLNASGDMVVDLFLLGDSFTFNPVEVICLPCYEALRLLIFLIMPLLLCRDLGVVSEAFHGLPLHLLGFEVVALCLFIVSKELWQCQPIPLVATLVFL